MSEHELVGCAGVLATLSCFFFSLTLECVCGGGGGVGVVLGEVDKRHLNGGGGPCNQGGCGHHAAAREECTVLVFCEGFFLYIFFIFLFSLSATTGRKKKGGKNNPRDEEDVF